MALPHSEDRDEARFDRFARLQVKDLQSGQTHQARMFNYSNGGIYFESDGLFEKGTQIHLCLQNAQDAQSSKVLEYCTGRVMWRKDLIGSFFNFGYGIQLVCVSGCEESKSNDSKEKDLRRHPRTPYSKSVQFSTHNGVYAGKTRNISASGIFIATEEKLEVGQTIRLNLPLKKNKTAEIIGKIVWLNEEGFGLEFQEVK